MLCLQVGEPVAGVAADQIASDAQARVLTLYVPPAWRRRYWGSELLDLLRDRLQQRGARAVTLESNVDDKLCMRFLAAQNWRHAQVTFEWPPRPPAMPTWRDLTRKIVGFFVSGYYSATVIPSDRRKRSD